MTAGIQTDIANDPNLTDPYVEAAQNGVWVDFTAGSNAGDQMN